MSLLSKLTLGVSLLSLSFFGTAKTISVCDVTEQTCHDIVIESNTPISQIPDDYTAGADYQWFEIEEGLDAGKKLFYFDATVGSGETERTILMVHGNPENSYTWHNTIKSLAKLPGKSRVVAMDHIGFGLSDQATYEMVDMHHSVNLSQLVKALDLRDITLLIHDWGGPIGVGALIDQAERVSGLVVVNSTIFPVPLEGEAGLNYASFPEQIPFVGWADFPNLVPNFLWGANAASVMRHEYIESGFWLVSDLVSTLVKFHFDGFPDKNRGGLRVFRDQFDSEMNTLSSKRMVRQTPVWGHGWQYQDDIVGLQDNRAYYQNMQMNISEAWKDVKVTGVFGGFDVLGQDAVLKQWKDALPQMSIDFHPKGTHFIEEFKYEEIANALVAVSK
jgi:pimeloyl-ACP methyl ester carboxylesterase